MKKSIFSLSAALLLSGALVGCGTNNNAANRNNAGVRPIGYNTGNDGLGYNNRLNNRNNNVGMGNNLGAGNNTGTANNNRKNIQGSTAANQRQARAIAAQVSRLKNVENVSVVVTNNDVLIGVDTNDRTTANYKSGIRKTAQSVVRGKNIHVTTDPAMYKRIRNVSNNLQNGNVGNEASSDIRGIINDLANAVKRPFQNNVSNR